MALPYVAPGVADICEARRGQPWISPCLGLPGTDNERVAEHMRVRPGDPHSGGFGELPRAAGGGVAVHPHAAAVEQDRPAGAGADRAVDGPAPPLAAEGPGRPWCLMPQTRSTRWPCSSPRSVISVPVASKIRNPSSPSIATRAKSQGWGDCRAAVSRASNCRWVSRGWVIRPGLTGGGRARRASAPAHRR